MATVKDVVLKHHRKDDGTYNVKIRVTHKRQIAYINTDHYVTEKELTGKLKIKSSFILKHVTRQLADYREKISDLRERLELFTAKELADHLCRKEEKQVVNIIEFGRDYVAQLREDGRESSASTILCGVNNIADYFNSQFVDINNITSRFLGHYELYLRNERKMVRNDQFGNPVHYSRKGMEDGGIHAHMRDLRVLFNVAKDHFNDEDKGIMVIKHYPFKKYKIVKPPEPDKKNLPIKTIRDISNIECIPESRSELARDMFMLSFYLCGMNAKDIYNFDEPLNGRVQYKRSKTTKRRTDRAFISLKLIPEAKIILEKYRGRLRARYSNSKGFSKAIDVGLGQIAEKLKISVNLTHYHARHSFADLARNRCGYSPYDISFALNHRNKDTRTTDTYIAKDWSLLDKMQIKVVRLIMVKKVRMKHRDKNGEFIDTA